MNLSTCDMCDLCNSKSHISLSKGNVNANVFILFNREALTDETLINEKKFINDMRFYLKDDIYVSYAIKCHCKKKIKLEHVNKCRLWVQKEIKRVKPYLVILVGDIAKISMFGYKYRSLPQNIFISKSNKKLFCCESVNGDIDKLNGNLDRLALYIRTYYS